MLGEDTVTEVDGLTVRTILFNQRDGNGYVDIFAGKSPLEVSQSVRTNSPRIPKRRFKEAHALDLWWLRTNGYEGLHDGVFERYVGRHFGGVAYRDTHKSESMADTVSGREAQLRYEIILSSLPSSFGAAYFPERHMDVKGEQFFLDPERAITDYIMSQTAELRSALKDDFNIYTYFEPLTGGKRLEMYVRFGLGPMKDSAQNIHKGLATIVDRALPSFQCLPYSR